MPDPVRLAEEIAAAGTRHVFGITGGGESLTLADALESLGVDFVRTHFEGSAGIMAGTTGRLTGHAGVALCIKGPGLANLVPGLALAWFEGQPVVAISEAYPDNAPASRAHKRMDQDQLVAAVTKCTVRGRNDPNLFSIAADIAESEIPGPVLLPLATNESDAAGRPAGAEPVSGNQKILKEIENARRPIVVAGSLAIRQGWSSYLNATEVPVLSTAAAKGVVDETKSQAAGIFTGVGIGLAPEVEILECADLIIGLGLRPGEVLVTKPYIERMVNIDTRADIPGSEDFGFASIGGADLVEAVFGLLAEKSWGLELVRQTLLKLETEMSAGPFLPWHAYRLIAERFTSGCRLVMDTGYFCTIGEHAWRAPHPNLSLMSGQGRYMGTCLPMAIGAALHDETTPTVAVVGDGGLGPFLGEVRLAVERRLPVLIVLMSDGRFGSIASRALQDGLSLTSLTMVNPSWVNVMHGFGMPVAQANSEQELSDALASCDLSDGPAYVEVRFDPVAYGAMVECLRA